jgi:DNA-binding SARP family transcriptional activator
MAVDDAGRVVTANQAAEELLGPVTGRRCCELFACRSPSGPCAGACVTRLVTERGEPLPETRVDPPGRACGRALWLGAAPRRDGCGAFLLVRASASDRRRVERTPAAGILRIDTLGPMRVWMGDRELGGGWLRHRPGQLLKYLVCRRDETVTADEIGEALWPEGDVRSAAAIRHFVHVLRERLEPGRRPRTPSSFVVSRRGGYALDPARVEIDAERFEHHIAAATACLDDDPDAALRALQAALDLYRGDFLADERYAEWALRERDRLRHLASRACRMLAQLAQRRGDVERAIDRVERLADGDPFDDQLQQALLVLYLRCGRRSDALRRFARVREVSRKAFGDEPPFDFGELVRMASADRAPSLVSV